MRLRYLATLSLASVAAVAQSISAATVKLSNSQISGSSGGPFTATVVSGPIGIYATNATFNTFCLEHGENFSPNQTYWAVVSDRAVFGANGTNGSGFDLLNPQTAYLYTNYMKGTMTSVVASWTGSDGDKKALQDAIWQQEGETGANINTSGATAGLRNLLQTAANAAVAGSWGNTIGNVRVLQLWTSQGTAGTQAGKAQDQLVLVPTPQASLAGMSLLGVMGVLGIIKRRRRNDDVI